MTGLHSTLLQIARQDMRQQDPMDDVGLFQEFLKESASEEMVDELFELFKRSKGNEFFLTLMEGYDDYRKD